MTKTTLIEAALNDDGSWDVKLGGEKVFSTLVSEQAEAHVTGLRKAYARGRHDERAEVRAILRGLIGV